MVKKHQRADEKPSWNQKREQEEHPESPTEGAVAPLCYTSLTNRPGRPPMQKQSQILDQPP